MNGHSTLMKLNHLEFQQVKTLKKELQEAYWQNRQLKKETVAERIKLLPDVQKQAVFACLAAAKRKGPHGNRFTQDWVYETILMRIKSPRLYEHIRSRKILILPSRSTLNRYMRKLHPKFGFQQSVFTVLKNKVASYHEGARRGKIFSTRYIIPQV